MTESVMAAATGLQPKGGREGQSDVSRSQAAEPHQSHDGAAARSESLASGSAAGLPKGKFKAIYADPPWNFVTRWAQARTTGANGGGDRRPKYDLMTTADIAAMPVADIAADDCVLFLWACWPNLVDAFKVIEGWGFTYKTCAFAWIKANVQQPDLFRDDADPHIGLGYWTRANSEPCLLATRGNPKRLSAAVRQGIIEPRREHSRKPDCVPGRIQQLVDGPYLELFARTERSGWTVWGNETGKFTGAA